MQVTLLCLVRLALAAGRAGGRSNSGGQGFEQRVKACHSIVGPADHQAVASFEAPHAAAGAAVDIPDPGRLEFLRAANVVAIVGVAAIDHDVAGRQQGSELIQSGVDRRCRNHEPQDARPIELRHKICQRSGTARKRSLGHESVHSRLCSSVSEHGVAVLQPSPRYVGAHAPESDESDLHGRILLGGPCLATGLCGLGSIRALSR